MDLIRADFDRIARAGCEGAPDVSLLRHLPRNLEVALEIGCGTGGLSTLLAERAQRVIAIDLSPEMIARAPRRPNLEYRVEDAQTCALPEADCIVSAATLHHLPFEETLQKLARALKPGGILVVHDLFRDDGLFDRALSAIALTRRLFQRRNRPTPEQRAAWAEHAKHDHFLTMPEVRRRARAVLPGVVIERHLEWRYTLRWTKPARGAVPPAPEGASNPA